MKIDFISKTRLTPEQEKSLPKLSGVMVIDLLGTCTLCEDVKNIFRELCKENGVDELEIMFYEEDSYYKDWEPTFKFRLYFREHIFFIDCESWSYPKNKEEYKKIFERYLKMTSEEIDIYEEEKKRNETELLNKERLTGPNYMKGFFKYNNSDEDNCAGEYYWNID